MTLQSKHRYFVDPAWPMRDGLLQPIDWSCVPRSELSTEIVECLRGCPVENASLLLRGSILEQARPHPGADVDIMILTEDRRKASADLSALSAFGRPVDAILVEHGSRAPDPVLWAAACTRALYVAGTPHRSRPITLNRQLLVDHWLKYGAFSLPSILRSQGLRRLAEVKQVIRSIGLVHGLERQRFSRDLPTCLDWSEEEAPALVEEAAMLFDTVQHDPSPDFDISGIQGWLRLHFYERIESCTPTFPGP